MQKPKKKILVTIDQISLSTGGFWTVIDIAESLKHKYEIAFCLVGLNYLQSIKAFKLIVKRRIPQSLVFIYPFLKRRQKLSLLKNIFNFIFFNPYKLFLNIYFYKQRSNAINYIKNTNIVFFSSFLSIEDIKHLDTKLDIDCIKIQNHAGSLDTLKNFSNSINAAVIKNKDSYLDYLSMQDKIILQSRLQKLEIDEFYPSLENKTFSFLPSVNENDLMASKLLKSPFGQDGCFNIVYVATIQHRKRQDLCIDIINNLLAESSNVNLYFVGEYNNDKYYNSLIEKVNKMNLQNNIYFTGYTKDFAQYMWHCDLIIHPSRAEGVPRVLREALFMGKAIIASNLEGNRDLFQKYNSAILIDLACAELYSNAILSLINDESLKLSYEKKARISYDNQLSFKQYQENVINLFD